MKEIQNVLEYETVESNSRFIKRINLFLVKPSFMGLFVFALFFTTILATKLFTYLLYSDSIFNLNIFDVLFSLIGFFIGFLFKFFLQVKKLYLN